jgi:CBS domain-containing membrane protein
VREPEAARDPRATAAAVMLTRVAALAPDDSLREAEALMRMGSFRALPVVRDERLVGLLYYLPLVRWCLARGDAPAGALASRLGGTRVAALMDAKPARTAPEDPLREAAARVAASDAGCIPVVDASGRFLGLVTESGLLRTAQARMGGGR